MPNPSSHEHRLVTTPASLSHITIRNYFSRLNVNQLK